MLLLVRSPIAHPIPLPVTRIKTNKNKHIKLQVLKMYKYKMFKNNNKLDHNNCIITLETTRQIVSRLTFVGTRKPYK